MKQATSDGQDETHFLNLDLDLKVRAGLKTLIAALEPGASALHHDRTFAVLELNKQPKTAEAAIMAFAKLIQRMPRPAQKIWNSCSLRSMNIGIQTASEPHSKMFKLSNKALAAAAACGCEVAFTVYVPSKTKKQKIRI